MNTCAEQELLQQKSDGLADFLQDIRRAFNRSKRAITLPQSLLYASGHVLLSGQWPSVQLS